MVVLGIAAGRAAAGAARQVASLAGVLGPAGPGRPRRSTRARAPATASSSAISSQSSPSSARRGRGCGAGGATPRAVLVGASRLRPRRRAAAASSGFRWSRSSRWTRSERRREPFASEPERDPSGAASSSTSKSKSKSVVSVIKGVCSAASKENVRCGSFLPGRVPGPTGKAPGRLILRARTAESARPGGRQESSIGPMTPPTPEHRRAHARNRGRSARGRAGLAARRGPPAAG